MTFPRRLTPSEKERATIVQQRMTPGGALGVGSRHVRQPPAAPGATPSATQPAGAIVASWDLHDSNIGSLVPHEAEFGGPNNGEGEFWNYFDQPSSNTLRLIAEGWYALSVHALVSGCVAGDVIRVEAITGLPQICVDYAPGMHDGSDLSPQAATAPFYLYAEDVPVSITVLTSGNAGTVYNAHLRAVRFAGTDPLPISP